MSECSISSEVLSREVEHLRRELAEANSVLSAIKNGEVDALLISGDKEDSIFILEGADHIYRTLVEKMQEGCATVAADGVILFCNKNFAEILKTPLDQVIGSSLYIYLKPQDREAVAAVLTGRAECLKRESCLKAGEGGWFPVLLSASNLTIDRTNFTCLVVNDLTEQKRSERFAQMIFDQAKEPIIACDKHGQIVQANPAAFSMFGDQLVGHNFDVVIPLNLADEDTRFRLVQALDYACPGGTEVKYHRQNGEMRYFLVNAGQLNVEEDELVDGYVVTLIDTTDKRKISKEMARLDRLDLIGEMAAGIGHEVRNPLTTVRGYLQMFQRKPRYEDAHEQFVLMIEELDRANTIITDFLSLAKDKAVDMKPGNLNDTLRALFPMLQAHAFREGHTIVMDLGDIPLICYDDKEIRQLILNMVRNGLEAMEASGEVTIQTYAGHHRTILAISDTGDGIPEEVSNRLGTPFLTTKEGGTGLGLSVCYRIADRHGAKIDVKSSSEGTTFLVKFKALASLACSL